MLPRTGARIGGNVATLALAFLAFAAPLTLGVVAVAVATLIDFIGDRLADREDS